MRYALFGDESTLPRMREIFGADGVLTIIASNRPQSAAKFGNEAVIQPRKTSTLYSDFLARLIRLKPDVFICFSYSMILGSEMLAIPPFGAINIHGGLLPSQRGANILNWTLVEDEKVTGVTAHYMTTGIDEGDIIFQSSILVDDDDSAPSLKERLDHAGFEILERIYDHCELGKPLPRIPQDNSKASYRRRRKPEDGRIDWSVMSDRQVFNLIRALVSPWPGAFCSDGNGDRVTFDYYVPLSEISSLRKKYG